LNLRGGGVVVRAFEWLIEPSGSNTPRAYLRALDRDAHFMSFCEDASL